MKLKNLLLIALVAIVFCGCQSNYQPTSITVASYNLRNANGGDSTISIFSARRSALFIN